MASLGIVTCTPEGLIARRSHEGMREPKVMQPSLNDRYLAQIMPRRYLFHLTSYFPFELDKADVVMERKAVKWRARHTTIPFDGGKASG